MQNRTGTIPHRQCTDAVPSSYCTDESAPCNTVPTPYYTLPYHTVEPSRADTVPYRTRHRTVPTPYRYCTLPTQNRHSTRSRHAVPKYPIPYCTIPHRHRTIPTDAVPTTYHERHCAGTVKCRAVLPHPAPSHITPTPYYTKHRTIPHRTVPSRSVPYHTIPYHTIPYRHRITPYRHHTISTR